MNNNVRWIAMALLAMVAVTSTACDKMTGLSKSAQSVTQRAFNDTKSSWTEFFTYHPPMPDPLPQTRYCYQMQSDVVCYDSEQPSLTAKLVGYQDAENIAWVQPGGGSLGASGGEPVAYRPAPASTGHQSQTVVSNDYNVSTGPVSGSVGAGPSNGHISVNTLPPAEPRKIK